MSELTELLPCPFCGSSANIFHRDNGFWGYCVNDDCTAETMGKTTREEAAAAWNRRTPMNNPVDQPKVSELRDRLKTARHMTGIPPAVDAIIEELFDALTPQATTVGEETLPKTEEYLLRAMAANYGDDPHSWDFLDKEACQRAADEIKALHSALIGIPGAEDDQPKCEVCKGDVLVWFAPNELWNRVKGGAEATDDPGGFLCPNCFIRHAESQGIVPTAWKLEMEDLSHPGAEKGAPIGYIRPDVLLSLADCGPPPSYVNVVMITKPNSFATMPVYASPSNAQELHDALQGVIAVADRKTDEFDRAKRALQNAGTTTAALYAAPTSERVQALPAGFVRIDVATANQIINDTLEEAAKVAVEWAKHEPRHIREHAEGIAAAIRALNHKSS